MSCGASPERRYATLARALLDAPDPVIAIAHELGDHAGRLDALAAQVRHLRAVLDDPNTECRR